MSHLINIERIKIVAQAFYIINEPIVFVGGATLSLYVEADVAPEVRPTYDVDVVVELATRTSYALLEEKLQKAVFQPDTQSGVLCRYIVQGIKVDVMPTEPEIIGFSNRWYPEGFSKAIEVDLGELKIKVFPLLYLIAIGLLNLFVYPS